MPLDSASFQHYFTILTIILQNRHLIVLRPLLQRKSLGHRAVWLLQLQPINLTVGTVPLTRFSTASVSGLEACGRFSFQTLPRE